MKALIITGILAAVTTLGIDKAEAHRGQLVTELRVGPFGFYTSEVVRHRGHSHKPRWYKKRYGHKYRPWKGHYYRHARHNHRWKDHRGWKRWDRKDNRRSDRGKRGDRRDRRNRH